jgi:hypothetical protein
MRLVQNSACRGAHIGAMSLVVVISNGLAISLTCHSGEGGGLYLFKLFINHCGSYRRGRGKRALMSIRAVQYCTVSMGAFHVSRGACPQPRLQSQTLFAEGLQEGQALPSYGKQHVFSSHFISHGFFL